MLVLGALDFFIGRLLCSEAWMDVLQRAKRAKPAFHGFRAGRVGVEVTPRGGCCVRGVGGWARLRVEIGGLAIVLSPVLVVLAL